MPTIKITKPQSQKQTTKQVVKQSVKVVIEAPKKKIRRKRRVAKAISKAASKITEQSPIYTPFYIAQPSTSQPSNVQTSAESLTATAFNPALDKVNNMRIEEGKKRGGLSTTAISLNDILPEAPEEIKELEPSMPSKPVEDINKKINKKKNELNEYKNNVLREKKATLQSLLSLNKLDMEAGRGYAKLTNMNDARQLNEYYDREIQKLRNK